MQIDKASFNPAQHSKQSTANREQTRQYCSLLLQQRPEAAMAEIQLPENTEPQARYVVYCAGKLATPKRLPTNPANADCSVLAPSRGNYPSPSLSWPVERPRLTGGKYCEDGVTVKKCQDWLQGAHPDMYSRIWSAGQSLAPLSSPPLPCPSPSTRLAG